MAEKKDFLESLIGDAEEKPSIEDLNDGPTPSSYRTETFTKIEKKKMNFNPKLIIGLVVALLLVFALIFYLFFMPHIKVPDFVGKQLTEFTSWTTQNGIDRQNVLVNNEYSFEYSKGTIIAQSAKPNSKIKKSTKLVITTSNGADPDEKIDFPDLKNMNMDEINKWIEDNKLLKSKVVTKFSDTVENGKVISYDLKNVTENNFTRGTSLEVVVSKGKQPAGQITVEDFTNKTIDEVRLWAKSKKINLEEVQGYSDTLEVGKVISQNIEKGKTLDENATLQVVVSKGKAIKIINLVGYTSDMVDAWKSSKDNAGLNIVAKEVYNEAKLGTVIAQSLKAGTLAEQGDVLVLTVSKYLPSVMASSGKLLHDDYIQFIADIDKFNNDGASLSVGAWMGYEDSTDYYKGQIIDFECLDKDGNRLPYAENGCARPLPIGAKISLKVSNGPGPAPKEATPPSENNGSNQ